MLNWLDIPKATQEQICADMATFYEKVDQSMILLPQSCVACGCCCNFAVSEHRLYASTLEFIYLLAPHQAAPLAPHQDICPFLQDGKCTARERRMLGCRVYFCRHSSAERIQAEASYEYWLTTLKQLHKKYGLDWRYADWMAVATAHYQSVITSVPGKH